MIFRTHFGSFSGSGQSDDGRSFDTIVAEKQNILRNNIIIYSLSFYQKFHAIADI